ncbi:MAG: hypothetical protein WB783_06865 [Arenicellales bacterium]
MLVNTSSLLRKAALSLMLALALTSCGGGTDTAGAGGSGIGGTGITTVAGNVSQIIARADEPRSRTVTGKMVAAVSSLLTKVANAQSGSLAGIRVTGGGRETTTDATGGFTLANVVPSANFVLTFVPKGDQSIDLAIGQVPTGSRVRVHNIVLYASQGHASAGGVEIEDGTSSTQDNADSTGQSTDGRGAVDNTTEDTSGIGGSSSGGGQTDTSGDATLTNGNDSGTGGDSTDSGGD